MPLTDADVQSRLQASFRRQCLFAVTILLVEDSRSASEAIRLMAAESGARVRRADSLHAAARHLAIYRPAVTVVDLGLPDGDGMALIRHLAAATPPYGGVVAMSGRDRAEWRAEALAAGASACLEKPIPSLAYFQDCILAVLPDAGARRRDDRDLSVAGRTSVQAAFVEDLKRARSLLRDAAAAGDADTIAYCGQFLGSCAEMLGDAGLAAAAAVGGDGAALLASVEARLDGPTGRLGAA